MDLPILSINGCYDGDQPGSLSYYKEFMQYATASAKNNHYLIIGPWDHAGTRTPAINVGGLIFGDSALIDMNDLHKQWYDFTLKDGPKPTFLKNKVAYFVTNRNKWKYASSLEDIGREKQIFYLNSGNHKANDVVQSAFLNAEPSGKNDLPSEYVYDPLDKRYGAIEQVAVTNYLTDQTHAYNLGDGGVIYHSAPFENETEVSGFFELKAYVETDVKDIDIAVEIYEIKANGESVLLTNDAIRARYRENREQEKLLKPGEINLFHFDEFYFISRAIEKGSRLRLIISSPNSIYAQKNYCSGGIIAYETAKDAHTAHVKIYNDVKYPSILVVPVVK
jgi:putative CocE/NonD family hydrolase